MVHFDLGEKSIGELARMLNNANLIPSIHAIHESRTNSEL